MCSRSRTWVRGAAVSREKWLARTSTSQARRLGMRRRVWCHVLPRSADEFGGGEALGQAAAEFTLVAAEEAGGCPGSAKSFTVETNQGISSREY
jgi:hypothetical protein